jgi:hypothetical protein
MNSCALFCEGVIVVNSAPAAAGNIWHHRQYLPVYVDTTQSNLMPGFLQCNTEQAVPSKTSKVTFLFDRSLVISSTALLPLSSYLISAKNLSPKYRFSIP